jgi:hypothetical protein
MNQDIQTYGSLSPLSDIKKSYLTIRDRLYLIFLKVDNAQLQFFAFLKTGSSLLTIMLYKILESNIVIKMQSQTSSKLKVHQREEVIS